MGGDSLVEVSGKKLEIKAQCPKGKSKTVEKAKEGREVRREEERRKGERERGRNESVNVATNQKNEGKKQS